MILKGYDFLTIIAHDKHQSLFKIQYIKKLTEFAINNLKEVFTGDIGLTPNMSGSRLVAFFNSFGSRDIYRAALPDGLSRNRYAENKLLELNGTEKLAAAIEKIVAKSHFNGSDFELEPAIKFINSIINEENFALQDVGGNYKVVGNVAKAKEVVSNKVHFEDIQHQIIALVDQAKFNIWVAVAWFTDPRLFNKLVEKKRQGINVQVLIMNDEINARSGLKFEDHFEVRRIKPTGYFQNITHHKFCVIDLEKVINGSYNWTVKAQYNVENITVLQDREIAKEFAQRFISIKTEN